MSLTVGALALAWAMAPTAAPALTAEDVLRVHRDRIELCEQAGPEILRQADRYQQHLETWIAYRRTWLEEMQRNIQRLEEEHQRARAVADQVEAVAPSLRVLGGDAGSIPHFGYGNVFNLVRQHRDRTNAAIDEAMGTVSAGGFRFHVSASGGGWLTRRGLEERIARDEVAIREMRRTVDEGSYRIHHPVLGWVSGSTLEACVAREEAAMAEVMAQIEAGEYRVHLPHLGWVTRNILEARIAQLRDEVATLEARHGAGEVRIWRSARDWFTRPGLDRWLDENQTAQQDARARAARDAFQHPLPIIGPVTASQIAEIIAQRQASIAGIRRQAADGEYSVPGPGGGLTANGARERLALPTCRPQGPSPCLSPETRLQLEDVLRRIPIAVTFDIAVRELEIRRLETWQGAIDQHLAPEIARLQTERGLLTMLHGEFAEDLREQQEHLQRQIRYLTDSLELVP
jgi:hypothetical protein